jgi:hypothetical protein
MKYVFGFNVLKITIQIITERKISSMLKCNKIKNLSLKFLRKTSNHYLETVKRLALTKMHCNFNNIEIFVYLYQCHSEFRNKMKMA